MAMQPRTASTLKLKVRMLFVEVLHVSSLAEGLPIICEEGKPERRTANVEIEVGPGVGQHGRPNGAYVDFECAATAQATARRPQH
jgi:hypothetical protein